MNSTEITDAHPHVGVNIPQRVLLAVIVAVALNLVVFWLASMAIGPLSITPPGAVESISITVFTIVAALVIPMAIVGTVVWLIARRRPGICIWAAWAGLAFGVVSAAFLFTMGAQLQTTAALATIHVIAGLAWFVCLMVRRPRA